MACCPRGASGRRRGGAGGDFETWVQAHWSRLGALARMICAEPDLAEDVLQDALIDVLSRWEKVSSGDNPMGYISRVMVSKAATHRRTSWRRRVTLVSDDALLERATWASPEKVIDQLAVSGALRSLNPSQRAAVALHYLMDYPVAQVSEMLDRPVGTITSDLSRARKTLEGILGGAGGEANDG